MKKILKILGALILLAILGLMGFVGWSLYPHQNIRPLPDRLVSIDSTEGAERLQRTALKADYEPLSDSYQAQSLVSYCGVATSVTVLGALGKKTNQSDFFTDKASQVRPRINVVFGGMSLPELAGLLRAHELQVSTMHADNFRVEQFREALERNLANADDYLVVNYQREILGQGKVGHISPVAAYDQTTDSVLIMDTAAHKYPFTWVPLELLYAAMQTTDNASGMLRGYNEVSR